ncbi:MAG: PIN domain nuclease [Actinomycetota bacterium]|nr:PIN domain nuclease [Actinomycetota bacterium]
MILSDTSAWIELIRDGDSAVVERLDQLLVEREVAITEPIAMEVLSGARDRAHAVRLQSMLAGLPVMHVQGLADWERAAALYRTCRAAGVTPRSQIDCLIAVVAIREDVEILHTDRDFDEIAKHTSLRIAPV